jgi:hypothetical protein
VVARLEKLEMVYLIVSDVWPSLYEKALAKWITRDSSDHPDITQTAFGDFVKDMAQVNDKKPYYYHTPRRSADDILGLVRTNCVSFRTINPSTSIINHQQYQESPE